MALFQSYAPPGVYTEVIIQNPGLILFGNARIPVLIGEGVEFFTFNNAEIIRGSSAVADNQVVNENLSDQVTGLNNVFQVTYFPVTDGTGKGTVTNDPSKIIAISEGIPLTVIVLNGATGQFTTQEIPPAGSDLQVSYYFKKTDTLIKNENESAQIPSFASLVYAPSVGNSITISLDTPGELGNNVTVAFTLSGTGSSDALAVSGVGTTAISIELREANNITVRTLQNILTLIQAGIPTAYGYLTAPFSSGILSTAGVAQVATNLAGGAGPQTNTTFKTHFVPIVDGTNGGVVTTQTTAVVALVNGVPAVVSAVDGQHGLVTLQNAVAAGSTLTFTYYTNQYQYTNDLLPAAEVASIIQVGLAPNRADFVQGVDYTLNQDGTQIAWGANVDATIGTENPNVVAFDPSVITTTLIDEKVFLRPLGGLATGVNTVFTTPDTVVDGSGLNRPTDNPSLIQVFVGNDPISAMAAGAVPVLRLSGETQTVTLFNPPTLGQNVYATYWRNLLADHTFTLTVVNPSIPGQGTYNIVTENNLIVALCNVGTNNVADANFGSTGIVWPFAQSDFEAPLGPKTETITLTFQDDGLTKIITPAVQATDNVTFSVGNSILFTASTPGAAPNGVTNLTFKNNAAEGISAVGTHGSSPVYNSTAFFSGPTAQAFSAVASQWQATTVYVAGDAIYDPLTSSIQVCTTGGTTDILANKPTFSATVGANSTPTPDGTVVWTSNGLAPASQETVFVNIIAAGAVTRTIAQVAALFQTTNVVSTPFAGRILAVVTGSGNATAQAASFFGGGVTQVTLDYSDRYLVTSSIAGGAGSGEATTPATPNVDAHAPHAINTSYNEGVILDLTQGGLHYLIQAGGDGTTAGVQPVFNTTAGQTTVDGTITFTMLGPVITPVGTSGYLGQTYVDPKTGTKWTIVDPNNALPYGYTVAPAPAYNFRPGDTLQLVVNANATGPNAATFITGATTVAIPGLRSKVTTTYGMAAGETAKVITFKGDANEPNVGEFYYITYTVNKTSADMALHLYSNPADAYAVYGSPNTQNRVSLGVQLLTGNGAQQFGVVQVPKDPATGLGSDSSYEAAIQSLAPALPGTSQHVNVIVPMSTSAPVQQYLSRFLTTQAAPRQKGEAIGFIGMSVYSTPTEAMQLAQALANERVILVTPFAFGIQITNVTTGVAVEYAVDGTFAAAALAGLNCNPANDVAQSLTNQNVVGFSRILKRLDDPTMDQMAQVGCCLLVEQDGGLLVRHYKTTDPSNILTSEPTSTTIEDYVSQLFRQDLKQFIGRKLVSSLLGSIQVVCNGRLKSLYDAQIIQGYSAPVVQQDKSDPTVVRITLTYQPIFTLLYIGVTFTVTSSSVTSAASSASGAGNIGSN